jgi:hypothetical protein
MNSPFLLPGLLPAHIRHRIGLVIKEQRPLSSRTIDDPNQSAYVRVTVFAVRGQEIEIGINDVQ